MWVFASADVTVVTQLDSWLSLRAGATHWLGWFSRVGLVGVLLVGWSVLVDYHRWVTPGCRIGLAARAGLVFAPAASGSTLVHLVNHAAGDTTANDVLMNFKLFRLVLKTSAADKQNLFVSTYKANLVEKLTQADDYLSRTLVVNLTTAAKLLLNDHLATRSTHQAALLKTQRDSLASTWSWLGDAAGWVASNPHKLIGLVLVTSVTVVVVNLTGHYLADRQVARNTTEVTRQQMEQIERFLSLAKNHELTTRATHQKQAEIIDLVKNLNHDVTGKVAAVDGHPRPENFLV